MPEVPVRWIVIALLIATPAAAQIGFPNVTPAPTLVAPMVEVGISSSHDTIFAIARSTEPIHFEIWDIDGNRVMHNNLCLSGSHNARSWMRPKTATPARAPRRCAGYRIGAMVKNQHMPRQSK